MADTFYDISVAGVTFEGRQELLAPLLDAGATVTTDPARIICGGLDSPVFGVRFAIMVKEAG